MKKIVLLPFAIILTILLSAITVVFAVEDQSKTQPIYEKQVDITGDGKEDLILINGTASDKGPLSLTKLYYKIKTSEGNSYKGKLNSGDKPKVSLNDLNHDGVMDLFIFQKAGMDEGHANFYLYSFKDAVKEELVTPETLTITTQYQDGYKANLKIDETGESRTFNLKDRKAKYEKLGLYMDGKLNEPMELVISPYSSFKPVKFAEGKTGLKGRQRIEGIAGDDNIGFVESIWVYDEGEWKLAEASIQKRNHSKKK